MGSNPLYEVTSDRFKAIFMLAADDDPSSVDNVDVEVILPDHTRWSATFISIPEIQRIMDHWRTTGECADGAYFYCTDLVIIRDVGIPSMVRFLERMIADGDHVNALTRLEESAPHNDEMAVTFNDDSTELPNPVRPALPGPRRLPPCLTGCCGRLRNRPARHRPQGSAGVRVFND